MTLAVGRKFCRKKEGDATLSLHLDELKDFATKEPFLSLSL